MSDQLYEPDDDYAPRARPQDRARYGRQRVTTAVMTVRFAALSIVATAVIAGGLAVQMAAGSDPALGPKKARAQRRASTSQGSPASGTGSQDLSTRPSEPSPSSAVPVAPTTVPVAPVTSTVS